MPVLIIALIALACFGVIGILLTAAVICESRKRTNPVPDHAGKPAAR
jgi:hypothetical protein